MALYKSELAILLLLAFYLSSSSSGFQETPIKGGHEMDFREGADDLIASRRSILVKSSNLVQNSSFVLAAERTRRKDPLNHFRIYTGGWNISNRHYLASCGYTAAPLFSVTIIWLVGFGLALALISSCYCCFPRRNFSYSPTAYAFSFILLILSTGLAIVGCIILYKGQDKFHDSTSSTLDFVMEQSTLTSSNITSFSTVLASIKKVGGSQFSLPANEERSIDGALTSLKTAADNLVSRTSQNIRKFKKIFDVVRLILIIGAAVTLLLVLLGFVFSILGIQFLVYALVVVGWFLVAGIFILCGVFLFLHNLLADTCVSLDEWVLHPREHTALDDIFPCVDTGIGSESLSQSREVTTEVVNAVNQVIVKIANVNYPGGVKSLYYNQSGPLMPKLCNPYITSMKNHTCAAGEVGLNNASQVWLGYVCQVKIVSGYERCITVGRITPTVYIEMSSAANVSYALYEYVPFLAELANCSLVRQTFLSIGRNNCLDLKLYSKQEFLGLLMLSIASMLSLILWIIYARQRRHRWHSKQIIAQTPLMDQTNMQRKH